MVATNRFEHFYRQFHPQLTGYGLWLRGQEPNRVAVERAACASFRVLFARLSTYKDTEESLTHHLLYGIAARVEGVYPDLSFLPPPKDARLFDAHQIPWLLGTQSKWGPEGFDLIGFSNSIVQELVNLPVMLSKSGIPCSKAERLERPDLPLIILGGANAGHTSLLLNVPIKYTLVDAIYFGENPDDITTILKICRDANKEQLTKREVLSKLSAIAGVIEPDHPCPVRKSFWQVEKLFDALPYSTASYGESLSGKLPISEGCPAFCRFCAESWVRKPYREATRKQLLKGMTEYKQALGLTELELFSFNFNMHSELYGIIQDASRLFQKLSIKSQRFDWLAHQPDLLPILHALGKSSVTCGLEGISPRLRRFLQKNLDEQALWKSLQSLALAPLRELKIFLIATGREEESDFAEFAAFLEKFAMLIKRRHPPARVIFSITPLVRFPWTPLEFDSAPLPIQLAPILNRMVGMPQNHGFETRLAAEIDEYLVSQILVRAAHPGIIQALLRAQEATRFVYYRQVTPEFLECFMDELGKHGLTLIELLKASDLESSRSNSWSYMHTGVSREFLWSQYQKAIRYDEDPYCLGRGQQTGHCPDCGACPDKVSRKRIVTARQEKPFPLEPFKKLLKQQQETFKTALRLDIGNRAQGVSRSMVASQLAAAMMQTAPQLIGAYLGFVASEISKSASYCWILGDDVITLAWHREVQEILLPLLEQNAFISAVNQRLSSWGGLKCLMNPNIVYCWSFEFITPFPLLVDKWLKAKGLKFTAKRCDEATLCYEFTSESKRKKLLRGLLVRQIPSTDATLLKSVKIDAGEKFEVEIFAREAFQLPHTEDWIRTQIRACCNWIR